MEVIAEDRIIYVNNESDAEGNYYSPKNMNKKRRYQVFDMEYDGNDDEKNLSSFFMVSFAFFLYSPFPFFYFSLYSFIR